MADEGIVIEPATPGDLPRIAALIRALAQYERLTHLCVASEADLQAALFAEPPVAEVRLARVCGETVGFALFFHTFSTFLGRPGLWLEDLFVDPAFRGRGIGKALLRALATIARGATLLPDWRIVRILGPELDRLGSSAGGGR